MTLRNLLLRAYPRSWRDEYGEELAGVLAQGRLTPGVVVDVLANAARQHFREPWKAFGAMRFAGGCLGCCVGLVAAVTGYPIPVHPGYSWIDALTLPTFFCFGGVVYLRKNSGVWEGATSSLKAIVAGDLPFVLGFLVCGAALRQLNQPWPWIFACDLVLIEIPQGLVAGLAGAMLARFALRRLWNA